MRKNTDARARGGAAHSSEESLVMRGERRDGVVQSSSVANPQAGMSGVTSTKPYVIAKRAVWEAYQQVKANRGAAGVDEETIAMFEQNLSKNLYKLWNRMSSGSYFPPPVKQVEIPKAKGGTRKLGIPTVSDRIAQTVVKQIIEPKLDPAVYRAVANGSVRDDGRHSSATATWHAARRSSQSYFDEPVHALCVRCLDEAHQPIVSVCPVCG